MNSLLSSSSSLRHGRAMLTNFIEPLSAKRKKLLLRILGQRSLFQCQDHYN